MSFKRKKMSEAIELSQNMDSGSFDPQKMTNIVHKAHEFKSSIVLHTQNRTVDVKSFLGVSISLIRGSESILEIHGEDEEEAKEEMVKAFSNYGMDVEIKE
ncbi:HPr family phosphocarrier protein [Salibacterium salarium]|uniref:HPr family phosphocarrier protein n=1 Tax=Salibacterium salarium TaxID=284579 RepID=A0A3R9Q5F7_9BACI|nr:HPr family phosphocarrier protein [Salibacterium salarium]RSL34029.1 HPr family phosphocarrier protein [Salibacterium salarium]